MIEFDELETRLADGSIASREDFYRAAGGVRGDVRRRKLREGLLPEFRAILEGLPNSSSTNARDWARKLQKDDVRSIHALHARGTWTHSELAQVFGVGRTTILDIIHGHTWPHLHPTLQEAS